MEFLTFTVLLLVAAIGTLNGKPTLRNDVEITSTARLFKVDPDTGKHVSLHKNDIKKLAEDTVHHLRLHFDDELSPLEMYVSPGSVWGKNSILAIRRGSESTMIPHTTDETCFMRGDLIGIDGAVSFTRCGELSGSILTEDHHYHLEEHEESEGKNMTHTKFKVTKRVHETGEMEERYEYDAIETVDKDVQKRLEMKRSRSNGTERVKRQVYETYVITIEIAIYLDSNFVKDLRENKNLRTPWKMRNWVINKWNKVQRVFGNPDRIGAEVTIAVKKIELWWENPINYPDDSVEISPRLRWFCDNTPEAYDYDQKLLYSANTAGHQLGLAYMHGQCGESSCYVIKTTREPLNVELHEMSHVLGFPHEPEIEECGGSRDQGFMGWDTIYKFPTCYKRYFQKYLWENYYYMGCLFDETNPRANLLEPRRADSPVPTPAPESERDDYEENTTAPTPQAPSSTDSSEEIDITTDIINNTNENNSNRQQC